MTGSWCLCNTATPFTPPPSKADLDLSGKVELEQQGVLRASGGGNVDNVNGLLKNYYFFSIDNFTMSFRSNKAWYKGPSLSHPSHQA